jgi:cellulose synthase/poly-beta-1,6-N-acetylglucosamine synthase-like glycosyltransferase
MLVLLALSRGALLLVEVLLAVPLAYLALLSLAALAAARRSVGTPPSADAAPRTRFALLVPAHDEAQVIGELLASLAAVDYPVALRDVHVVADNCTDGTAAVVRAAPLAGVRVWKRHDVALTGKGYALRWLLEQLEAGGHTYDAYVVVDADSRVSPNLLRVMATGLAGGAQALQARYRVANESNAWTAGLRAVAFALFNHVRPLGRLALGWSAGLKGNGMCFAREVIERQSWGSYTLAEDAEYHLSLIEQGVRVRYVPEAVVTSAMPTTLRQARSQQQRWERGRLLLARAHGPALVRGALRHADLARLDAIVEVCLPPISLLAGLLAVVTVSALALPWLPGKAVALALVALFALHVLIGLVLANLPPRAYLSLLYAPWYIVWKIGLYVGAAIQRGEARWVRTDRAA